MTATALQHRKRTSFTPSDDYLELVIVFPLRPLRSKLELNAASAILDHYLGRPLTPGQRDYVSALVQFVHEYERRITQNRLRKLKPVDLLKHLMRENKMNTTDLGFILGTRGLASEVLNGKRGLSKTLIVKLATRFHVEPSLFFEISEAA
jgi:HTH-type transcriptional regulator/antitoxin HigA